MEVRGISLGGDGEGKVGITIRGSKERGGERGQSIANSKKGAGKRSNTRGEMMNSMKV